MPQFHSGQVVEHGTEATYVWRITYTGGVGQHGQGSGIFNWLIEIERISDKLLLAYGYMAGEE